MPRYLLKRPVSTAGQEPAAGDAGHTGHIDRKAAAVNQPSWSGRRPTARFAGRCPADVHAICEEYRAPAADALTNSFAVTLVASLTTSGLARTSLGSNKSRPSRARAEALATIGLVVGSEKAVKVQKWGKHAWAIATESPITRHDGELASKEAVAALDESFFRVRFDRPTPAEKTYLRAMADLGPGPHRSGDIADLLGRRVTSLGPTRSQLIVKGMIWSPSHGDTAFTVPLFDEFMRRIMPGEGWKL